MRSILVLLILIRTVCSYSQSLRFTEAFECKKKNVPIAILNKHPDFFYVLRYNKSFHDFVVERRLSATGELRKATAMGLDVINANWFNYEYLDYIFHEWNGKVYLIFEKVLVDKRELYFRALDSLGRPGNFTLMAALDKAQGVEDIDFEFKLCGDHKVLIIGREQLNGGRLRKLAIWYDLQSEQVLWAKKLPLESPVSGYSGYYETNALGDLYFVYYKTRIWDYVRKYMDHAQAMVPLVDYDFVSMACVPTKETTPILRPLMFSVGNLNYASITSDTSSVLLSLSYSAIDTVKTQSDRLYFLHQKWSHRLGDSLYAEETILDSALEKQLDFYDGMDYSAAAYKDYPLLEKTVQGSSAYFLSARNDGSYYKEMLLTRVDLTSGKLTAQHIVPRKVFVFESRTRYKNLGTCNTVLHNNNFHCFLLENPANAKLSPDNFIYRQFAKQNTFDAGDLVAYSLSKSGALEKRTLIKAENFEYIPVPTQNSGREVLFYLANGSFEKFAFMRLE